MEKIGPTARAVDNAERGGGHLRTGTLRGGRGAGPGSGNRGNRLGTVAS